MITFKRIRIQNYYSIKDITLDLPKGINKVYGVNRDVGDTSDSSNGLGKSSVLTAIYQGLYNKNPKNSKGVLADSYNKVTGLPYIITVEFTKGKDDYKITNDRAANNITINKNGTDISKKGIKIQLQQIEEIIGLDYPSFSALTFLSQNTVSSVFDLTNDSNILYKFFEIDKLKLVEKELKLSLKDYKTQHQIGMANITSIDKTLSTLNGFKKVDIKGLYKQKSNLQDSIEFINNSPKWEEVKELNIELEKQQMALKILDNESMLLKREYTMLSEMLDSFNTGVCPTCNQSTKGLSSNLKEKIDNITEAGKKNKLDTDKIRKTCDDLVGTITKIQNKLDNSKNELQRELQIVTSRILVVNERMKDYKRIKATSDDLEQDKRVLIIKLAEVNEYKSFITAALGVIKSGTVTKEYISNFILLLNNKIQNIIKLVKLPILINTTGDRGKLTYQFTNKMGDEINYDSLSSGEKTRVALVVLVGIIDTLESLTGVSLNYVVYDELLSVLDKQGLSVFKTILEGYREEKSIFVVIHHNELEDDFFDKEVHLIKEEGLTSIQEIE